MTSFRDAVLAGTGTASEVHDVLGMRTALEEGLRALDVFGTIHDLGLPLDFSDLEGLLGACIRVESTTTGLMVTAKRDLHMQRFTAAHELGHFVLEHEGSLDRVIELPDQSKNRTPEETEATAFAAQFLLPKWLIAATAKRRRWWTQEKLATPDVAYQLSLRLAVSYEAMRYGLQTHSCIDARGAGALANAIPKDCKHRALGQTRLEDPWADVWNLDATDHGAFIEAGPTDILVVTLSENAAAGYSWNIQPAVKKGFEVLDDRNDIPPDQVGAPAQRRLILKVPKSGVHKLLLEHRRPFEAGAANAERLEVLLSTAGRHEAGSYSSRTEKRPRPR